MDYSLPVAKRTRLREAQYYKELYERKKRNGVGYDSVSGSGISGSGNGNGEGSAEVEVRVLESAKSRVDSESTAVANDSEEDEVEVEVEEIGIGGSVDFVGFESSGSKGVQKGGACFENSENVVPIDVDASEDDGEVEVIGESDDEVEVIGESDDEVEVIGEADDVEVEVIGEGGGGFDFANSNCSSLKTGVGSKVGGDKGENFVHIDVDEVVSKGQRVVEGNGVNLNGGKSCGGLKKSESLSDKGENFVHIDVDEVVSKGKRVDESNGVNLNGGKSCGGLKKSRSVSDVEFVDSDELESSSEDVELESSSEDVELESSSEEDNDDSEDDDYRVDNSCSYGSLEQPNFSGEDEDGEDVDDSRVSKRGSVDEVGKKVGAGSKRKEVDGPDVLVVSDEDKDEDEDNPVNITQEHNCVAQRTRSRFGSRSSIKKMKLGTVSRPLCVDDGEIDFSSGRDGGGDDKFHQIKRKTCCNNVNDDNGLQKVGGKDEQELEEPTKRKRVCVRKDYDVLKILVDSIWEKGEVLLEESVSSRGEAPVQETNPPAIEKSLPLKFTFGVEESHPLEKSEDDKQIDKLWAEFDFVLRSCEIGSVASFMVESEDSIASDVETDQATLCRRGNHYLILDEQVGLTCKFCSFVELEIKYIVPSFSTHHWGRLDRKYSAKVDYTIYDELQLQDSGCDSQSGCDPCVHAEGTVWDIIPGVKNSMFPHQREGFEFIWKNVAGGICLDELKSTSFDGGSGCVISHAPGTGKTRLTIVFLQTYMELYPTCRPVIIAPRTMLLTWEEEFKKWKVDIPFHNLNKEELSGKESVAAVNMFRQVRHEGRSKKSLRMVKLFSWKKDKSILGISYRLFEKLAGGEVADGEGKKKSEVRRCTIGEQIRKILLELPGLLVLDEGHTPRNEQSLIWKALSKIETERRIILSGTPFQNNFNELYNTLCLVRPKFADTVLSENYGDFQKKRGRRSSAARGKWASLTNSIGKVADAKAEELRAMIDPFVHVHKGTILQKKLPGLRHSVVVLQPAHYQKSLLEDIRGPRNMFELGYWVSLISVHPSLAPECFVSEKNREKLQRLKLNPAAGVKTKFLIELIRLSAAMKEKVLVFSQFIDPLIFIRDQLKSYFDWSEDEEVLYMDGQCGVKERQSSINNFNDSKSKARVLLASTKACSEGINLVGASRVVLLDVVWNPSVERQAISRAYRLGQKKVVYIYHLITSGTIEGEKYDRQAEKDRLSELVFSSADGNHNRQKILSTVSDDKILEEMVQHEELKYMFEKIIYQPKESNLMETFSLVDF